MNKEKLREQLAAKRMLEQAGISLAEGEVSANCEANSTTSEQGGE